MNIFSEIIQILNFQVNIEKSYVHELLFKNWFQRTF